MVILVRVIDGVLKKGQKVRMMATGAEHEVDRVGVFTPKAWKLDALGPGEIGFITAGIKTVADCKVGDTMTEERNRRPTSRCPASSRAKPVVFCGLFPVDANDFEELRESLAKLALNDASFVYEPETSAALGFGFRCGFLGLLHLEIIQERLEREFDLDLITTAPSVVYKVHMTDGDADGAAQPGRHAGPGQDRRIEEPWIKATIWCPTTTSAPGPEALHRAAGRADRPDLCRQPGHGGLPPAAERGGVRLLRPAEVGQPRLRQLRLPDGPATATGDLVKVAILVNGRAGRRARHDRAPRARPSARPGDLREAQGTDPAPAVQDRDPGSHRRQDRGARDRTRHAQGRDRQVLRRRHHAQAQAAGEAEGRQATRRWTGSWFTRSRPVSAPCMRW